MIGDRKEQYQNLRNLSQAPKTKETYEQIIFAYINGAAEYFNDLDVLCSSLERSEAHPTSKEYLDYEFIHSVRHANNPNRYDEYANVLGYCLREIGASYFGIEESSFDLIKTKVLAHIVEAQNPKFLAKAMQRTRMTSLPSEPKSFKRPESDIIFKLFYAPINDETFNFMLGMYEGAFREVVLENERLNNLDISGIDFNDSRIDEIIEFAISAAEARARAEEIKGLLIRKFGSIVVEPYTNKIEKQQISFSGISK